MFRLLSFICLVIPYQMGGGVLGYGHMCHLLLCHTAADIFCFFAHFVLYDNQIDQLIT